MKNTRSIRRAGFTIIEVAISAFVLVLLSGALTQALIRLRGVTEVTDLRTQLQDSGERAINLIVSDLRRSGFVTVAGTNFPYLFDDGVITNVAFNVHAHAQATENAAVGDPDFGVNREIVMAQPLIQDLDGDGLDKPTLDANGNLMWSNNVISYIVVTGADGVNYLERRVNAGSPRRIASFVERIWFEDDSLVGSTVPDGAIRVRIWFRRPDDAGNVYRHSTDVTVSLRNG